MQEQTTHHSDDTTALGEVRMRLGETTELTRGGSAGNSEDKRYIYN